MCVSMKQKPRFVLWNNSIDFAIVTVFLVTQNDKLSEKITKNPLPVIFSKWLQYRITEQDNKKQTLQFP